MSKAVYTYVIEGTAADYQTWIVRGIVECEFKDAFNLAVQQTFDTLLRGKANYGNLGKGCNGPYRIIRTTIIRNVEHDQKTQMASS